VKVVHQTMGISFFLLDNVRDISIYILDKVPLYILHSLYICDPGLRKIITSIIIRSDYLLTYKSMLPTPQRKFLPLRETSSSSRCTDYLDISGNSAKNELLLQDIIGSTHVACDDLEISCLPIVHLWMCFNISEVNEKYVKHTGSSGTLYKGPLALSRACYEGDIGTIKSLIEIEMKYSRKMGYSSIRRIEITAYICMYGPDYENIHGANPPSIAPFFMPLLYSHKIDNSISIMNLMIGCWEAHPDDIKFIRNHSSLTEKKKKDLVKHYYKCFLPNKDKLRRFNLLVNIKRVHQLDMESDDVDITVLSRKTVK